MTNKNNKPQVIGTNEIMSAMLSHQLGEDTEPFKSDPNHYVDTHYGVDLTVVDVAVVENTMATMHLALPYYASLEELSAETIADADMNASGSEVVTVIALIVLAIMASTALVAGASTLGYGVYKQVEASQDIINEETTNERKTNEK